ncbi:hypothetical protein A3F34_01800 [Candidatus Roizmanbacteria bacterium RIFCSPHIGHO2_12_FULL_44_10]|uniref:Uncharacterized protein n=1 Tax=Candidatus Roizmanbacteria bacterium RIFCSPHIGHO2_12_FULL_44_10 TaxID=1802054 RepID=A0A1F7I7E9_9BACT|nr:MAG: hypothetical protein A3F34_01800 [Candidatus Roizmanbacteria bacterium RIFCSPHIGHO2_12_FULL_44_10]
MATGTEVTREPLTQERILAIKINAAMTALGLPDLDEQRRQAAVKSAILAIAYLAATAHRQWNSVLLSTNAREAGLTSFSRLRLDKSKAFVGLLILNSGAAIDRNSPHRLSFFATDWTDVTRVARLPNGVPVRGVPISEIPVGTTAMDFDGDEYSYLGLPRKWDINPYADMIIAETVTPLVRS